MFSIIFYMYSTRNIVLEEGPNQHIIVHFKMK